MQEPNPLNGLRVMVPDKSAAQCTSTVFSVGISQELQRTQYFEPHL